MLLLIFLAVTSPYAGEEARAIKSLSEEEIASLQRGYGRQAGHSEPESHSREH